MFYFCNCLLVKNNNKLSCSQSLLWLITRTASNDILRKLFGIQLLKSFPKKQKYTDTIVVC